jgi:hypothetical protein
MQVSKVCIVSFVLITILCVTGISIEANAQNGPETAIVYVNIDREWPSNDPEDGESWETAYRFLQDGLDKAEFLLETDPEVDDVEIWVAQGTYRTDQSKAHTHCDDNAEPDWDCCPPFGDCAWFTSFNLLNSVGIEVEEKK